MSNHASRGKLTMQGAVWALVFVTGLSACKGWNARPALLPPTHSAEKHEAVAEMDPNAYRAQGGEPIAPVVISDDPLPSVAPAPIQPSGGGPPGQRPTLNGNANGLTREALNIAIQGAMGSVASCFSALTQDPMVAVSFEADPSGRPSLVRINGAPSDAERCIRNVVQGIRFPAFEGKGVQVDLPLSFHRIAQSPQQGNPQAQQPAQAPLFLQP
jgi:hypothetical protein